MTTVTSNWQDEDTVPICKVCGNTKMLELCEHCSRWVCPSHRYTGSRSVAHLCREAYFDEPSYPADAPTLGIKRRRQRVTKIDWLMVLLFAIGSCVGPLIYYITRH